MCTLSATPGMFDTFIFADPKFRHRTGARRRAWPLCGRTTHPEPQAGCACNGRQLRDPQCATNIDPRCCYFLVHNRSMDMVTGGGYDFDLDDGDDIVSGAVSFLALAS